MPQQHSMMGKYVRFCLSWLEEDKDLMHESANGSDRRITFAKLIEKLDLLIGQMPWVCNEKIAILPQNCEVSVVYLRPAKLAGVPHSGQNAVSDAAQIVKHTELVPYHRPDGLRDIAVETRAIRDHYLRLDSKLIQVHEELKKLLLVGTLAEPNREGSVVQRVSGYQDNESVIKLVQSKHARKAANCPGLVVFDQINLVGSFMEPAVSRRDGRSDMEIAGKPFLQTAKGRFICTDGETSFVNCFAAVMLPAFNEIWLEAKELVAGSAAVNSDPNLDGARGI